MMRNLNMPVVLFELKEPQVVRSFNDHTDIQYYPLISQSGALGVIGISTESGTAITDQKLIFLKSLSPRSHHSVGTGDCD
jgi:hypothetical protein